MASISVAPFRTIPVGPDTVVFDRAIVEGLPWEPAARVEVLASIMVDPDACRSMACLPEDAPLLAVLEVWCDSTYWSSTDARRVPEGACTVDLRVEAPPGALYGQIQHRRLIVLGEDVDSTHPNAARHRGSILATSANSSVTLSGEGGQFPTELVNFARAGLSGDARWSLRFRHEGPDDPVLGTVSLLLNEDTPAVRMLRNQTEASEQLRSATGRELRRFVVAQLIRAAIADPQMDDSTSWPEHSVGHLFQAIVDRYTGGRSLDELRGMAVSDRQRFEALLDGAVPDVG